MTRVILTTKATEESTYPITITFRDENSVAVAPNTAQWTLTDMAGTVINSRQDVAIVTPTSSETILLSGLDLAIADNTKALRLLTVEYTYDSSLGTDLPAKTEVQFEICPLVYDVS